MQNDLVYPDAARPLALMEEVKAVLTQLLCVSHLYLFGSLAENRWDRWSDVDMLVVTPTKQHIWEIWGVLHQAKPVLHHHPLSAAEPFGVHILGNVFVGESVFHCLDLNFLTLEEYHTPGAMARFNAAKELNRSSASLSATVEEKSLLMQELTADEEQLSVAIHFTKKNIKKILRGYPTYDELQKFATHLRTLLENYSVDYEVVGGKIVKVAEAYLTIAAHLLETR